MNGSDIKRIYHLFILIYNFVLKFVGILTAQKEFKLKILMWSTPWHTAKAVVVAVALRHANCSL